MRGQRRELGMEPKTKASHGGPSLRALMLSISGLPFATLTMQSSATDLVPAARTASADAPVDLFQLMCMC